VGRGDAFVRTGGWKATCEEIGHLEGWPVKDSMDGFDWSLKKKIAWNLCRIGLDRLSLEQLEIL
jgi:hypothetical protein